MLCYSHVITMWLTWFYLTQDVTSTTDGLAQLRTPIRINYTTDKLKDKYERVTNFLSPPAQTMEQTPSPMYITPSPSEEREPTNKRSKPSGSTVSAGSAASAGSSAPYWDDWEDYTSGTENHDNSFHDKHHRYQQNHDSHTNVNANPVSSTERRSPAAEETKNRNSSPHLTIPDRQAMSLSNSINSIAESFPRHPTPDGYLEIMAALKLLGQGVQELREELSVVGGIEHKVRSMETQISNLESELGVVHDKIDDICQATVIDSSCSSSSAHYVDRGNKSKLW